MRRLHTPVCSLEPQVAAHAPALFAVLSDPAIYEFENAPPASVEWLRGRFERLESRQSPDGGERWLNWVVRLPGSELAGYVQATVIGGGVALVAYELASRFWRRGIGSSAVRAVEHELASRYGVRTLVAVLKAANFRSKALLSHLGFTAASTAQAAAHGAGDDEIVMQKAVAAATPAAGPVAP